MKLRAIKTIIILLSLCMVGSYACAEEVAGVEMVAADDNKISIDKIEIGIDYSGTSEVGDSLVAHVTSDYILSNSYGEEMFTAVATIKTLKVKKVTVKNENKKTFESGETLLVNGRNVNGYIYPIGDVKKLTEKYAYKDSRELVLNMDYSGYYSEAFKKYGIFNLSQYNLSKLEEDDNPLNNNDEEYYILDDEGEEMLALTVYNLRFKPLESKTVHTEKDISGSMTRPSEKSKRGTCFSYSLSGINLKSFYTVYDTEVKFKFSNNERLGLLNCDAPYFSNDGVITIRYTGPYARFNYKLGEELTKEEINMLWAAYGSGRIIMEVVQAIATALLGVSVIYIVYSVKKRRQSGIGMNKENYF